MKKSKSQSILLNPWVYGISITIIGGLIVDKLKNKPIFSTITDTLTWIYSNAISILTFKIPLYITLLILLILLIIYFSYQVITKNEADIFPPFTNYKTDSLKQFKWSWNWYFNKHINKWVIEDLRIHCPKCDTKMKITIFLGNYEEYQCPRCSYKINNHESGFEEKDIIEALIIDNLDKGKF